MPKGKLDNKSRLVEFLNKLQNSFEASYDLNSKQQHSESAVKQMVITVNVGERMLFQQFMRRGSHLLFQNIYQRRKKNEIVEISRVCKKLCWIQQQSEHLSH